MPRETRRRFLTQAVASATAASLWPALNSTLAASNSTPDLKFPTEPRERIAIASYPFRDFIARASQQGSAPKMDLKDFAAHVSEKLNIRKIEPWSRHFRSLDPQYLKEFRATVAKAQGAVVNIAVDGDHSIYAANPAERDHAIAFSKQWIDVAAAIGSPSIRTNIAEAKDSKLDLDRAYASLQRVAEYAASKNILVNLENDNPATEDPFFLVKLIEKVNSPWLHSNPDFCNTLAAFEEDYAYKGLEALFHHAYSICHVKAMEPNGKTGKMAHVDIARAFAILKRANYRGYCSMEFDSPGDPYAGTSALITQTLQYL